MTSRFFAKVGAAVVAGGTLVALAAAPASASGYDGTDPAKTHCDAGAYTVRSHRIFKGSTQIGLMELRYSPKCRTAWGRITRMNLPTCGPTGTSSLGCGEVSVWRNSDGDSFGCNIDYGTHGCYTPQVNDSGVTSFAYGDVLDQGGWPYSGQTGSY